MKMQRRYITEWFRYYKGLIIPLAVALVVITTVFVVTSCKRKDIGHEQGSAGPADIYTTNVDGHCLMIASTYHGLAMVEVECTKEKINE
jgi:hypothetical protein